jgi:diguanylate cyclase (GGDEF)-like protein
VHTAIETDAIDRLAGSLAAGGRKILVAEDNPISQSMLRNLLTRWGYDVVMAHDGREAWRILGANDSPRLVLLDWMMPGIDGVELCRRIRAQARQEYTYVLLLSARTESHDVVEGMDSGADDYLTKPLNAHELRVRLRAGRRILDLQEQLLEAREALHIQATHDGLTGLLNRNSILEALEAELARAARERNPLSVMMIDLDQFKAVNDTYGHLAGDAVLREAALRIQSAIRRYDSVGRYGGEEFLIVLPGCGPEDARFQGERVRRNFSDTGFLTCAPELKLTCSIGAASCFAAAGATASALVHDADVALYRAKDGGRDRVVCFAATPAGAPESSLERTNPSTSGVM